MKEFRLLRQTGVSSSDIRHPNATRTCLVRSLSCSRFTEVKVRTGGRREKNGKGTEGTGNGGEL